MHAIKAELPEVDECCAQYGSDAKVRQLLHSYSVSAFDDFDYYHSYEICIRTQAICMFWKKIFESTPESLADQCLSFKNKALESIEARLKVMNEAIDITSQDFESYPHDFSQD